MGGIQAREGSLAEVHAVRGGQLILRVSACQTSGGGGGGTSGPGTSSNGTGSSSSSKLNLVIPYEGRCYLLQQSMDVLEKIFLRLTPRELALLSLTCRTMNLIVNQFLDHFCSSYGLREKLKVFYEENCDLLLPKELVLKDRLELNSRHELLLYSTRHQFLGSVRRVSVCDIDTFAHLGQKPDDLFKERDVALKRNVVVIRKLREFYFRHCFKDVSPGKYYLQLRIRLSNARWTTSVESPALPATIKVTQWRGNRASNGSAESFRRKELIVQKIDSDWWGKIELHQLPSNLEHATFVFDRDSDWLFMRLENFRVPAGDTVDLEFEFDDSANQNWKHGMILDFLELRSVVKMLNVT